MKRNENIRENQMMNKAMKNADNLESTVISAHGLDGLEIAHIGWDDVEALIDMDLAHLISTEDIKVYF